MIKTRLTDVRVKTRAAMDFYKEKPEGKEVVAVHSGVGKISAAVRTQILADVYGVTGMVNTGIAGSLKVEVDIGDIMFSSDAVQCNMDTTRFDYEPGQVSRVGTLAFKADEGLIHLVEECCSKVNPDIHTFVRRVVTGDQFISDKDKKKRLTDTSRGYCTEVEGAAIAQAYCLNSISFLIAGMISDKTDDSATAGYSTFRAKIVIHSVNLLTEITRSIRFR